MGSKTEDAVKSFKGWQEALYLLEDETEAGKKTIKDAEKDKADRDKEKPEDVILKFDKDAKKKTYPAGKINAPKTATVGKVIEYILDIDIDNKNYKYKDKATEEDKKNIRWSLHVQGEAKTDKESTYITDKSKSGLYTYAKTEVVDNKIKLTIVFDKALKGKKVQIEQFRGTPDLSTKPDFVRTTTIKEPSTPKITIRDTAKLYLKIQGDDIESTEEERANDVLKSATFKIETPNTIHIYDDGKMSKLNLDGLKKVKYRYHDANGNKHDVCECKVYETWKMGRGSTSKEPIKSEKDSAQIVDYKAMNIKGVDAYKTYVLSNNDVYTEGKKIVTKNGSYTHLYYIASSEKITMIILPNGGLNYSGNNTLIKFKWHETLRKYSQPEVFAAFVGALAECGFSDIDSGGSSYKDGSSYPSRTHNNGYAIDTGYLDNTREQQFIDAMKKFGFISQLRGANKKKFNNTGNGGTLHDSHLHSGGSPKKGIKKFKPNYK
ncbi:hypothetical protein [Olleya sp. HaHaR_3_96]|uniref:hypothetical protein n=1 Tax=Olleya sp. HaHaR_3_96 TaxID=2745560 RepID=UPI001C4FF6AD|nr:hypothetical protein [Olleya sp. HaHaR_3_96]QXP58599.1 hypothetical protein H0I26_11810 [Olleya sp. HaHaR_3_96]